jgi:hypothetical protein
VSKVLKALERVLRGSSDANIRFDDLWALLLHFGFVERMCGDHHIFTRDDVPEILNWTKRLRREMGERPQRRARTESRSNLGQY